MAKHLKLRMLFGAILWVVILLALGINIILKEVF